MPNFLENIKLFIFKIFRRRYKKSLFKEASHTIEHKALTALLRGESLLFIDIGANQGEFIFTAEKIIPASSIWAFEPLPYFAKKLKSLFPAIHVFNIGLSDAERSDTLYVPLNKEIPDYTLASLKKPEGNYTACEVICDSLDKLLEKEGINKKIFLKIDVEGHEFEVLKGASKTLADSVWGMLIEIEERHHQDKSLNEMISKIESEKFHCYYFDPAKPAFVPYTRERFILQKTEDINTDKYINNFWFFASHTDQPTILKKLNSCLA